jgi:N6-adenosine-specific RNA methylase IME4
MTKKELARYAKQIQHAVSESVRSFVECGRLLSEVKAELDRGEFTEWVESELPFGIRTAQRLMAIAADKRISKATHGSHLPASWHTLYEITKLSDSEFNARLRDGTISPETERSTITAITKRDGRVKREAELASKITALPDKKFGVILADPEWRFEPWSRKTGMDRAADNHSPTSTLDVIKSRDVASIAAPDCVLFLWATIPMLPQALEVMEAWSFKYKSHCCWKKDKVGTGFWYREKHELLLLGTRGKVPCPAPGTQFESLIEAMRGRHSAKPEIFLEMIEKYFPNIPKIELNRRGPARPGWLAWGAEAEAAYKEAAE